MQELCHLYGAESVSWDTSNEAMFAATAANKIGSGGIAIVHAAAMVYKYGEKPEDVKKWSFLQGKAAFDACKKLDVSEASKKGGIDLSAA